MTKTYAQLIKQIEALTREAETVRRKEIEGVVTRIKEAIEVYGLSAKDLGLGAAGAAKAPAAAGARKRGTRGRKPRSAAAAAPKFRNEAGQVWSGRGPRPKWLREALSNGKTLADFKV